eukprot:jgi/Botrbrau1/17893/Bobra.0477s0003.1
MSHHSKCCDYVFTLTRTLPSPPFVSLLKEVEVSHWGNVYVEEIYELKHGGALHKGVWSRLDFMSNARVFGQAAFNEIVAVLPAGGPLPLLQG